MTFKKFNPLVTYLKQESGLDIRLVVPKDSVEFERDLKSEDIDFVLQDPYTYVRLAGFYNKDNLLGTLTREGTRGQSGVVIVRKDSGIKKMEDLRGKTVIFGPKLSATNWAKVVFDVPSAAVQGAQLLFYVNRDERTKDTPMTIRVNEHLV